MRASHSFVLGMALTSSVFVGRGFVTSPQIADQAEIRYAGNAAYRDGMFVGSLHRQNGLKEHIPWGRWSEDADRRSFVAGYKRGYQNLEASR